MRILLVNPDPVDGQRLMKSLTGVQYEVDWVRNADNAASLVREGVYAVIFVGLGSDVLIGRCDSLIRQIRSLHASIPIIAVLAVATSGDVIAAIDAGADDCVSRITSIDESAARLRAIIRRKAGSACSVIRCGSVSLDINSKLLVFSNRSAVLSAREYSVMMVFLCHPGYIFSREQLEERIYGWRRHVEGNAIDVIIYGIRKKLGREVLRNVRGVGWSVPTGDTGSRE